MEKKRSMEIMVELLKDSFNYIGREVHSSIAYDIDVREDGNSIFVYNSELNCEAFYWTNEIINMASVLHLNYYVTRQQVVIGETKYGDGITKNLVGIRIY